MARRRVVLIDGNENPVGHSGGDPLEVSVSGAVAQSGTASGRPIIYYYGASAEFTFPVFDDTEYQQAATAHGAAQVAVFDGDGDEVPLGVVAVAHGSSPSATTAGERTEARANRHGIPFHIGGHPNIVTIRANYTAAQTDTAIVSASSGQKIVVTQVMVTADAANSADVAVRIGFGASNTPTTTGVVATHPGLKSATGGGFVRGDGSGILGVGADGEDLRITSEVPTSGSIDVLVSYFIIES